MVKKLLCTAGFFLFVALQSTVYSQCYELIWSDEFDYTGFPDPQVWTFETGGGGWGNNELQYYKANDEDNSWVADGKLTITALNESYGGRNYTSARLITRDKYYVQYGKIEARMKLPYGKGLWAAFWAMGQNIGQAGWPACGEIDIMEFIGGGDNDNDVYSTLHWDNNGHQQYGKSYTLPTGIFADDFHVFSMDWTPTTIRSYMDGKQYFAIDIRPDYLSEFHQDFFILLNLAVGGNWPGSPDASTVFPQTYEIDYVRVYKKSTDIAALSISGDDNLPAMASGRSYSLPAAEGWTYNWSVPADASIVSGQGTESILVDWGCNQGSVSCIVQGSCESYDFSKEIGIKNEIHGPQFIGENEGNILFYVDSLSGSEFLWSVPDDAVILSGQGSDSLWVNWGTSFDEVLLETANSCGTYTTSFQTVVKGQYPYPDISMPHLIPGLIEAVDFDYGGEGVAYHDSGAGNQGTGPRGEEGVDTQNSDKGSPNVGWVTAGEWLEYTIKVDADSFYNINMRLATANATGGPFSFFFNGEQKLAGISLSNTGGWDSFVSKNVGTVYLRESDSLMRIYFNGGGFNLGKITFTPTTDPKAGLDKIRHQQSLEIFPVPSGDHITINSDKIITDIRLIDLNGRVLIHRNDLFSNEVVLDLKPVEAGYYIIRAETEKGNSLFSGLLKE